MVALMQREYEGRKAIIAKLDRKVLAVAIQGTGYDWAAYIGAVEGQNHEVEWQAVAKEGSKLPGRIALAIFAYQFPGLMYRE